LVPPIQNAVLCSVSSSYYSRAPATPSMSEWFFQLKTSPLSAVLIHGSIRYDLLMR
jgi:hypothetical protein